MNSAIDNGSFAQLFSLLTHIRCLLEQRGEQLFIVPADDSLKLLLFFGIEPLSR
jgi:hypothetical protein